MEGSGIFLHWLFTSEDNGKGNGEGQKSLKKKWLTLDLEVR